MKASTGDCMSSVLSLSSACVDHVETFLPHALIPSDWSLATSTFFCPSSHTTSSSWAWPSFPLGPCGRPLEKAAQYLLPPSHSLDANVLLNATSMAAEQWDLVLRGPPLSSVLTPSLPQL